MPQAKSINSFPDCGAFMNKAAEATKGYRQLFADRGAAHSFRMRCYTLRTRTQKRNEEIYQQGHPMFGCSVWDTLVLSLVPIERRGVNLWALEAQHTGMSTVGEEEIL